MSPPLALNGPAGRPDGCLLIEHEQTWRGHAPTAAFVKVFGCRPMTVVRHAPGPAYENLQGRKPRWGGESAARALWRFERGRGAATASTATVEEVGGNG